MRREILLVLPLVGLWMFLFRPVKEELRIFYCQVVLFSYFLFSNIFLEMSSLILPYFLESSIDIFIIINNIFILVTYQTLLFLILCGIIEEVKIPGWISRVGNWLTFKAFNRYTLISS